MWDQRLIKAALLLFPVLSLQVCAAAVTGTAGCAGTTLRQERSPPRSVRTFPATLSRQVRPNYWHLQRGGIFFPHHHSVIWRCCSCLDRRKFSCIKTGTSWWMTAVAVWCNKYVVMKKNLAWRFWAEQTSEFQNVASCQRAGWNIWLQLQLSDKMLQTISSSYLLWVWCARWKDLGFASNRACEQDLW